MKKPDENLKLMKKAQDASDDDLDTDIVDSIQKRQIHKPISHKANQKETGSTHNPAKTKHKMPTETEDDRKDTKTLTIIIAGFVLIAIIFILVLAFYRPQKEIMTVDDLHAANLEGKLDPELGYVYNGYSFIKFSGIWYSQLSKGDTLYDVTFNNDPRSVEDIPVEGMLSNNFKQGNMLYITFDPDARGTKYITVANAGLSMGLVKAFGYPLKAGCTSNESATCRSAGVITCEDPDKAVIYFKESEETKIILDDNCVTVQGYGPEIVRAKDRLLMRWYGMMD